MRLTQEQLTDLQVAHSTLADTVTGLQDELAGLATFLHSYPRPDVRDVDEDVFLSVAKRLHAQVDRLNEIAYALARVGQLEDASSWQDHVQPQAGFAPRWADGCVICEALRDHPFPELGSWRTTVAEHMEAHGLQVTT